MTEEERRAKVTDYLGCRGKPLLKIPFIRPILTSFLWWIEEKPDDDFPKPLTKEQSRDVVCRLQYTIDCLKMAQCQCDLSVGFVCETCSEGSLLCTARNEIVQLRYQLRMSEFRSREVKHSFEPHSEHEWFCKKCGYGKSARGVHFSEEELARRL